MPKLLQINATANWGSTGRIAEEIGLVAMKHGWESYIAYGRHSNPSASKLVRVGSLLGVYFHYFCHKVFDGEGFASKCATRKLIKQIEKIAPDIVHLHNIHDHWINYPILFDYLNSKSIPVVWTQHDCWAFTGGCAYYTMNKCSSWQTKCCSCNLKKTLLDRTQKQFAKRKELFCANSKLTLVAVSSWLEHELKKSFMGHATITSIYNGIDLDVFRKTSNVEILEQLGISNKKVLLALATSWSERKGFDDYIALSKILPKEYVILLVGLSKTQIDSLPDNMIGISRTSNREELVSLYSSADILLNLSYEETFGLTTVEAFACGTPAIVYNATACPEIVSQETGIIVDPGDIQGVIRAIERIENNRKESYTKLCRARAEALFDKNKCYEKYINLYDALLAV